MSIVLHDFDWSTGKSESTLKPEVPRRWKSERLDKLVKSSVPMSKRDVDRLVGLRNAG